MSAQRRTRRLFFALWPDDATRAELVKSARKAVHGSGGRPVPAENLHSTVAFLGSAHEERLPQILEVGESLPLAPFEVTLDRVEHWPKPMVLCAMCSQPSREAAELATELRTRLAELKFEPDPKPFRCHVTLARKVAKPHALGLLHEVTWKMRELALVESDTTAEGSRYTILRSWPLSGSC